MPSWLWPVSAMSNRNVESPCDALIDDLSQLSVNSSTAPERGAVSELVRRPLPSRNGCSSASSSPIDSGGGVLQPLIWLILFGALFANAPDGMLPGHELRPLSRRGVIVFTAFSGALNAGLPVMFDREFGSQSSARRAAARSQFDRAGLRAVHPVLSLLQSLAIMITALWGTAGLGCRTAVSGCHPAALVFAVTALSLGMAFALPGHIELIAVIFVAICAAVCQHGSGTSFLHAGLAGLACGAESSYLRD